MIKIAFKSEVEWQWVKLVKKVKGYHQSSVQLLGRVQLFVIPGKNARLPCPSLTSRACSNHAHGVSDAIQSSHPLLSPSPPTFHLSQHDGLFQ